MYFFQLYVAPVQGNIEPDVVPSVLRIYRTVGTFDVRYHSAIKLVTAS